MLPAPAANTYYLIPGYSEGTKFVCRKCQRSSSSAAWPKSDVRPRCRLPRRRRLRPPSGEIAAGSIEASLQGPQPADTGGVVALKVLKESDSAQPPISPPLPAGGRARRPGSPTPGIVPVLDSGEADGVAYIAMSAVEGLTLDRALSTSRPDAGGQFVEALEQVALADPPTRTSRHRSPRPQAGEHRSWMPPTPHVTDFGLGPDGPTGKKPHPGGGTIGDPLVICLPEQVIGDVKGTDPRSRHLRAGRPVWYAA